MALDQGVDSARIVQTVGGAFVVGNPRAVSFEELIVVNETRPQFPPDIFGQGAEKNGEDVQQANPKEEEVDLLGIDSGIEHHPLEFHPLENMPVKDKVQKEEDGRPGVPIEKDLWYSTNGDVFRLSLGKNSNRRHLVYEVFFSGQSIGLTLSCKDHIFVQAVTGLASLQLGLIAKGDIILCAASKDRWIRCTHTLTQLLDFLKEHGRPVVIRFWRRPEPMQLGMVLNSNGPLEVFLNFISRYLESANFKEIAKNEKALEGLLATVADEGATTEDELTDIDSEDGGTSDGNSNGASSQSSDNPSFLAEKYLNSAMAQVMFLVEVSKIRQRIKMGGIRYSQMSIQNSIKTGVATKYLQRRTSDFSIKDVLKKDRKIANARKEVLNSGSIQSLDVLYDHILELVRNDTFALFLHEKDCELALEKTGEKNGWKLKIFSQLVRRSVPIDIILDNNKCCYAFILFLLTVSKTIVSSDTIRLLALWTTVESCVPAKRLTRKNSFILEDMVVKHREFLLESTREFVGNEINTEALRERIKTSFEQMLRQFLHSELGLVVSDAFNMACSKDGDGAFISKYMPRLQKLLQDAKLPDNFVIHRAIQDHELASTHSYEERKQRNWSIKQGMIFRIDRQTSKVEILLTANEEALPPQIELFIAPHGLDSNVEMEHDGMCYPQMFNFVFANSLYGCTLVFPPSSEDADYCSGVCVLSDERKLQSLRTVLSQFYLKQVTIPAWADNLPEAMDSLVDFSKKCEQLPPTGKSDGTLRSLDFSLEMLFELLSYSDIIKLFESYLLERKVLFVSEKYSALTVIAESMKELIAPLQWCHIFAPILPRKMLSHLECPTPFLIGINASYAFKGDFPFVLDAVVVNLDNGSLVVPNSNNTGSRQDNDAEDNLHPDACLPEGIRLDLVRSLRTHTQPLFNCSDTITTEDKRVEFPNDAIRHTFHKAVKHLLKDVSKYCLPVVYEKNSSSSSLMIFDEHAFLAATPDSDKRFYKALLRTQGFSAYTSSHL
mmetsp:Transcript_12708/g.22955  ORF Transcript_12708/g.22955 Transcript_12708/m.22955 type:complete len:1005 (+) Transcript_12708:141-3155(+)|eukprot:CAMPEP_0203751916 /NCGR_PEP_ID=MMETSP0098-20131031/5904_1 /ASSEMBLY_ACC=CAM_ASM_000208 /TAXON_ID=96639 /ORGANISM=" , Strain NY0313808BC1" /LENGTH=1004 /DNA_ID=CAMNT_0050641845 /DNA_START=84 /DNA_END=3098 /DNA_ORIENTATION=-